MKKEKTNITDTFITQDLKLKGKLMQLGRAFIIAVDNNNSNLAKEIIIEAQKLKNCVSHSQIKPN